MKKIILSLIVLSSFALVSCKKENDILDNTKELEENKKLRADLLSAKDKFITYDSLSASFIANDEYSKIDSISTDVISSINNSMNNMKALKASTDIKDAALDAVESCKGVVQIRKEFAKFENIPVENQALLMKQLRDATDSAKIRIDKLNNIYSKVDMKCQIPNI